MSTYICLSSSTEKTLEAEQPQYASCRSLLRSGPAASLRVNIRAVSWGFLELFSILYVFPLPVLVCL